MTLTFGLQWQHFSSKQTFTIYQNLVHRDKQSCTITVQSEIITMWVNGAEETHLDWPIAGYLENAASRGRSSKFSQQVPQLGITDWPHRFNKLMEWWGFCFKVWQQFGKFTFRHSNCLLPRFTCIFGYCCSGWNLWQKESVTKGAPWEWAIVIDNCKLFQCNKSYYFNKRLFMYRSHFHGLLLGDRNLSPKFGLTPSNIFQDILWTTNEN